VIGSAEELKFAEYLKGVPVVSFARIAPKNTATIHNSYDTLAVMKADLFLHKPASLYIN
jgi:hypothetical protein